MVHKSKSITMEDASADSARGDADAKRARVVAPANDGSDAPDRLDARRPTAFVVNEFGQRIGPVVEGFREPPRSRLREGAVGRTCELRVLSVDEHAADLFDAFAADSGAMWTYLSMGPFKDVRELADTARVRLPGATESWVSMVVVNRATGKPEGVACYLAIEPASIEIGTLMFSPLMRRSVRSTEALYLMMRTCFDLGWRRVEWKCNALNDPSRACARRLGFKFDGRFPDRAVVKGRARDTDYLSVLASEWPEHDAALREWLRPDNFRGPSGAQVESLRAVRERLRAAPSAAA